MRHSSEAQFSKFAASAWPQMYRTAVVIVGDRQLAEDLVQSALVRTYLTWPRLRDKEKAHSYARRIMVNLSNDLFRKHSWSRESVDDLTDDRGAARESDHAGPLVERISLERALRSLPPGQRAVVALRFLEDLSVRETADLLNVSAGTVKSQTAAALTALRSHSHLTPLGGHHD